MTNQNISTNLAARGYDLVAYFDGHAVPGDPAITSEYENTVYYFSSNDNKARFDESPAHYIPAYGGWCAYAMSEGNQFDIDPTSFKIIDGQLYLFYNGVGGDTKSIWESGETTRLKKAEENWKNIQAG